MLHIKEQSNEINLIGRTPSFWMIRIIVYLIFCPKVICETIFKRPTNDFIIKNFTNLLRSPLVALTFATFKRAL